MIQSLSSIRCLLLSTASLVLLCPLFERLKCRKEVSSGQREIVQGICGRAQDGSHLQSLRQTLLHFGDSEWKAPGRCETAASQFVLYFTKHTCCCVVCGPPCHSPSPFLCSHCPERQAAADSLSYHKAASLFKCLSSGE